MSKENKEKQIYSGDSIASKWLSGTWLGNLLGYPSNTYIDGYGTTRNYANLEESAQGQQLSRMKDTAKNYGKVALTGMSFGNPLVARSTIGAVLPTGAQSYFITEGLRDAYNRFMKKDKTAEDAVWTGLDLAGAIPAVSAVRNGYRFVKPAVKSGLLKVVDPHKTIYTNPQDAQRAASLYHTNYTMGGKNLSIEDLESTQWYRKPRSYDEGKAGFVTPSDNKATILSPEDSDIWAHEGRHQLDADIRNVDFDEFSSFNLDGGFSGKDLPTITTKPDEYNILNQVYTKDVPLAEKVATNSENRFKLWNDLYRNLGRVPSTEELNQFISNQNRFQLYRDMLFGNDYIDHRTRMNALFHPEKVKNAMIGIKRNGGIVKRVESGKSGIHINPENRGKFTASAKRAGMGVQEYARKVLNDPNATPLQKRRANFARNAKKFKHN